MDKARKIFKKVWIAHFGHSKQLDADLEITLGHDYIFESMEQYAQQEYERGFKDGKEVQRGWEELKDSGLDKPFNHQNQQQ